jgi:ParB family chromosome partitioning protein
MKDNLSEQEFAIIPTVVSGNQEMVIIDFLKIAIELLRQARTLEDTQDVWQKVNALEALSKKFRLSKDVQLDATELRIRIERRLGEILSKKNQSGEGGLKKQNQNSVKVDLDSETSKSIRSNLNFTKNDLSKFQELASTPQKLFEAVVTDLRTEAVLKRQTALSTTGILRAIRNEHKKDSEPLFSPIIKPSDNWNFSTVQYGRIDEELEEYRGYIPGEIYANCFWYYVKPGDLVIAPMAGSGQAWRVYEARQEWMSQHVYDFQLKMFDLTPRGKYKDLITQHDLTKSFPVENPDYIVMDIPYYGMVAQQYSNKSEDLANMSLEDWQIAIARIAKNCATAQKTGTLCTVISPNYRDVANGLIVMVTDIIRSLWESAGYILHDKAYSSRRIQQNQTPHMARMNNKAKANRIMLTDITEILTFRRV